MNGTASVAPFLFFEGAEQLRNLPSIDLRIRNPSCSPSRMSFVRGHLGSAPSHINHGKKHRATLDFEELHHLDLCVSQRNPLKEKVGADFLIEAPLACPDFQIVRN